MPRETPSMNCVYYFLSWFRRRVDWDVPALLVNPVSWNTNGFQVCVRCPLLDLADDEVWSGCNPYAVDAGTLFDSKVVGIVPPLASSKS